MKSKLYKLEFFLLLITIVICFIKNSVLKLYFAIALYGILLIITFFIYGKKKDNDIDKGSATRKIIAILLCYLIILLILGIFIGFNKTLFSIKLIDLFRRIISNVYFDMLNGSY